VQLRVSEARAAHLLAHAGGQRAAETGRVQGLNNPPKRQILVLHAWLAMSRQATGPCATSTPNFNHRCCVSNTKNHLAKPTRRVTIADRGCLCSVRQQLAQPATRVHLLLLHLKVLLRHDVPPATAPAWSCWVGKFCGWRS